MMQRVLVFFIENIPSSLASRAEAASQYSVFTSQYMQLIGSYYWAEAVAYCDIHDDKNVNCLDRSCCLYRHSQWSTLNASLLKVQSYSLSMLSRFGQVCALS